MEALSLSSFYQLTNETNMRYCIKLLIILLLPVLAEAQQKIAESLGKSIENASTDSANFHANMHLCIYYEELNIDSSLYFSNQAFLIAKKDNQPDAEAMALNSKGYQLLTQGQYKESLKCLLQAYGLVEKPGTKRTTGILKAGY